MPYKSIDELPKHVKKYPEKVQKRWMEIWNSIYDKTGDEGRAFAGANSMLKEYTNEELHRRYVEAGGK